MFTWSVRVGCKFPACRGESVKYQTCLIFPRPFPTLVPGLSSTPLVTSLSLHVLSVSLPGLSVTLSGLSLSLPGLSYHEAGLSFAT